MVQGRAQERSSNMGRERDMRFLIAFLIILITPRDNACAIGFALLLCAWSIYDRIDKKADDIQDQLDDIKKRLKEKK